MLESLIVIQNDLETFVWSRAKTKEVKLLLFFWEEECGCAYKMENLAEMQNSSCSSFYIKQLHGMVQYCRVSQGFFQINVWHIIQQYVVNHTII